MRRGSSVIGMAGGAPSFMVEYEWRRGLGVQCDQLGRRKKKKRSS